MHALGLDDKLPATASSWECLATKYDLTRHVTDRTLTKRLSRARWAEVMQRWPTVEMRRHFGCTSAAEVLKASITCAESREWNGQRTLGGTAGKKKYKLPLLDYDDLLYMPCLRGLELDPNPGCARLEWVFVDEGQDTCAVQQLMLQQLLSRANTQRRLFGAQRTRLFVVGDDMQGLYSWAGRDPNALDNLNKHFACREFALPVCHRCPRLHVQLANEVINKTGGHVLIKARDGAAEGRIVRDATFTSHPLRSTALVLAGNASTAAQPHDVPQTKAILARRNAPLVALLYCLAARGYSCRMAGRKPLANKLRAVLDALKASSVEEVEGALPGYVERKCSEANAAGQEEFGSEAHKAEDLAECLQCVIEVCARMRARARVCVLMRECACVRACMCACVRACVRVCVRV